MSEIAEQGGGHPPIDDLVPGDRSESLRKEVELAVAEAWKTVFHRDRIDRDENFFELGGNSLLGMDLTELLVSRLNLEIPVVMLFKHPTIRDLCEAIVSGDLP